MSCNNRYKKSTLNAYSQSNLTVETDGLLSFANFKETGCSIRFNGGTSINVDKPGLYQVIFNANAAESAAAGNIAVQLYRNGMEVPGAIAEAESGETTDIENLAFSTIVEVPPSCCCVDNDTILTVVNIGVSAVYSNANISVVKLC